MPTQKVSENVTALTENMHLLLLACVKVKIKPVLKCDCGVVFYSCITEKKCSSSQLQTYII